MNQKEKTMADKDDAEEQDPQTLEEIVSEVMGTPAEDDEAAKVEEKPEPDEEETPSEDERAALIARAKEAGFKDATIEALGDDLPAALVEADQRAVDAFRAVREPDDAEEAEAEPKREPKREDRAKPEPLEIDEDAVDPTMLKAFRILEDRNTKFYDELEELRDGVKAIKQTEKEKRVLRQQSHDTWCDERFAELGTEWEDIFGIGSVGEVSRHHLSARQAVDETFQTLEFGLATRGKKLPSRESLFERALLATYPERAIRRANAKDDEADQTARGKHAATGVARPSGRKAKPQTPNDGALADVAAWRRGKRAASQ